MAGILPGHRYAARIVLESIAKVRGMPTAQAAYGLTGGNALIAHHLSNRKTMDVDVAISQMRGDWSAIEAAIEAGLMENGYIIERVPKIDDIVSFAEEGDEIGLSEWVVQAPGTEADDQLQVQVSNFELLAEPVMMPGIGPVVGLDDAAGWKTVAFASRRLARDALDVAELLTRYTCEQLIALALERDAGLEAADFADAGRYVDGIRPETLVALVDGTGRDVAWLRAQLANWPRTSPPRR